MSRVEGSDFGQKEVQEGDDDAKIIFGFSRSECLGKIIPHVQTIAGELIIRS